jgi:hypothetical protein
MTRIKAVLAVGLGLVALLALSAGASAKGKGALPDLVVTKISKPPASKVAGGDLKVVVKVKNKGTAPAGKSRVGIYLGTAKKHKGKDKRLKRVKVKPLAPGKAKKLKTKVVLPAKATAGTYRVFACSDDTKKVKEAKEGNCVASKAFKLNAKAAPLAAATPAFTISDGIDWGFSDDFAGNTPKSGDPITATLRAANGLAGQAGYTQTAVAPTGFLPGPGTEVAVDEGDDGTATVALPFAFPFGGISETSVSVGTNGWVSFGAPAWDYWDDSQPDDYRGISALVGSVYRGIMPYWDDLDLEDQGAGTGTLKMVSSASSVAFQWDLGQHTGPGTPRRSFQLVLFPDGSFRLDYPGVNTPGGDKSFVGFSLGGNPAAATIVSAEGTTVPPTSVLFTPNPVTAGDPTAAGQLSTTLPGGSSLLSADPGCALAQAPGAFSAGLVTCAIPALGAGQQAVRNVTFSTPPNAPGQPRPANFRLLGSYLAGSLAVKGSDELDLLSNNLAPATITLTTKYKTPATPETGVLAKFGVEISTGTIALDEPTATFTLPAATTFVSAQLDGGAIDCDAPVGTQLSCRLPSGIQTGEVVITVIPTPAAAGSKMTLGASVKALNAPPASGSATSPVVT